MDPAVDLFTGLEEETLGSFEEDLLAQLVLPVLILGVSDVAELVLLQNRHLHGLLVGLVHVQDVGGRLFVGDKPLLTGLALHAINIFEGLLGLKQEGGGVVDDLTGYLLDKDFVNASDVEADVADKPFFSGVTVEALGVDGLARGTDFQGLARYNGLRAKLGHDLGFNSWDVDLRSELEPLVTSNVLNWLLPDDVDEVTEGLQLEGLVARDHRQLLLLRKGFPWVQRERLGVVKRRADLRVPDL